MALVSNDISKSLSALPQRTTYIFAHGVWQGGGLTLLKALMGWVTANDCVLILDERAHRYVPADLEEKIVFFPQGILGRIRAEAYLAKAARDSDIISFNSLPLVNSRIKNYYLFFQNVHLIAPTPVTSVKRFVKMKIFLRFASPNIKFIVQSQTTKELLQEALADKFSANIEVLPFIDFKLQKQDSGKPLPIKIKQASFIYTASALVHKNHGTLLDAWKSLALDFNVRPKLVLTIPREEYALVDRIDAMNQEFGTKIINLGEVSRETVFSEMEKVTSLIYPSLSESYGLPLLEARLFDLDILASEKSYVWEVCHPAGTFDPLCAKSIARCVAQYIGLEIRPKNPLTGYEFMDVKFGK